MSPGLAYFLYRIRPITSEKADTGPDTCDCKRDLLDNAATGGPELLLTSIRLYAETFENLAELSQILLVLIIAWRPGFELIN